MVLFNSETAERKLWVQSGTILGFSSVGNYRKIKNSLTLKLNLFQLGFGVVAAQGIESKFGGALGVQFPYARKNRRCSRCVARAHAGSVIGLLPVAIFTHALGPEPCKPKPAKPDTPNPRTSQNRCNVILV